MSKKISDLREALFDTLDKVRSKEMSVDVAKQVCEIAQVIINSANAETSFLKTINTTNNHSGFMSLEDKKE